MSENANATSSLYSRHAEQRRRPSATRSSRIGRHPHPIRPELNERPTSVAISAPDVALRYLGPYGNHRCCVDEPADIVCFRCRIAVIELENDRVCLTAVDARVRGQVFSDQSSISRSIQPVASPLPAEVRRDVLLVVRFAVVTEARSAVRAEPALRGVLELKFRQRLRDVAACARPERGEIGHRDTRGRGCGALSAPATSLEHLF
jgi:hypothetical protein